MLEFEDDFFKSCTSLKALRIPSCELKQIPSNLHYLQSLKHLDVSSNYINKIDGSNLEKCNKLKTLLLANNRFYKVPVELNKLTRLVSLNLSNNWLNEFPSVLGAMPYLMDLDLSFNNIKSIPVEIGQLVKLNRLILTSNLLSGPLLSSFSSLVRLRELDIRQNSISSLDPLTKLPRLELLFCDYNLIYTLKLEFTNLKHVNICKNSITQCLLPSKPLFSLSYLNISYSKLVTMPDTFFEFFPGLQYLILDNNHLVSLPTSINFLTKLTTLNCSNNVISGLPKEVSNLRSLKILDLHDNNLRTLPKEIWLLPNLTVLNISSNLIEYFPNPLKTNQTGELIAVPPLVKSLKVFLICDNRVTDEVFGPISHLTELMVLNLSYNDLDEILPGGLRSLTKMVELYLSGNQLTSLPSEEIEHLRHLRILHLNGNKLPNLPAELGKIGKLHTLDIGSNVLKYNIGNWPYDWNWNWNLELKYLNLSGNQRLEIKPSHSYNEISATNTNTSTSNQMVGIPRNLSDFSALAKLVILGLVDITCMVPIPIENYKKRIQRTCREINNIMGYGVADFLGKMESSNLIHCWDVCVEYFRGTQNELLLALIDANPPPPAKNGTDVEDKTNILVWHISQILPNKIKTELNKDLTSPLDTSKNTEKSIIVESIRKSFLALNRELGIVQCDKATLDYQKSLATVGASCVMAYIKEKTLYIANVGESVAVLSRNGDSQLISKRHTPWSDTEKRRIRSTNGFISSQGLLNGVLETSRGFGRFLHLPCFNSNPSIQVLNLSDQDDFLILANRALWDKISYQAAVDIVRTERDDLLLAAQKVRDFALGYGTDTHIMVIILGISELFDYAKPNATPLIPKDPDLLMPTTSKLNKELSPQLPVITKRHRRQMKQNTPGDSTLARLDKEVEPPIGKLALVFTDIRNSNTLWETSPTAMRSAIRIHNSILRRSLRNIGGYEVKTEGDAFMVAFPNVATALLWCLTIQLQLLDADWPKEILDSPDGKELVLPVPVSPDSSNRNSSQDNIRLNNRDSMRYSWNLDHSTSITPNLMSPNIDTNRISGNKKGSKLLKYQLLYRGLTVKMGIHYGSPVCEIDPITKRMDYFGPMVNRSARVTSIANGGEICLSSDVVEEIKLIEEQYKPDLPLETLPREVRQLKKIGFTVVLLGEKKMKGLEDSILFLAYPKKLVARWDLASLTGNKDPAVNVVSSNLKMDTAQIKVYPSHLLFGLDYENIIRL